MDRSGAFKAIAVSLLLTILAPPSSQAQGIIRFTTKLIAMIQRDNLNRKLSYPSSLFYDFAENELYVTSSGKVIVYASDYFPISSLGKGRGLLTPVSVYADKNGNLYVCQSPSEKNPKARISVYNAAFLPLREIYFEGFEGAEKFTPRRMAIGKDGKMYVAGIDFRGLVVLDRKGRFLNLLAPKDYIVSPNMTRIAMINDVTIDKKGRIYLLSEEMGRIYVYDENERFLFKFGQKGGSTGKLSRPRGIAVDNQRGRVYVIDYMRHTANVYSLDGKFLGEFGGRGWGPGWFNYPSDIAVDDQGNVIVADTFNQRVQVLKVKTEPEESPKEIPNHAPDFPAVPNK